MLRVIPACSFIAYICPMKLLGCFLFSAFIFLTGSKNLLFIIDYEIHADYYENLCVNRSKPELKCHGKCQVTKKMQTTSESEGFTDLRFEFHFFGNEHLSDLPPHIESLHRSEISNHIVYEWKRATPGIPHPPPDL